MKEEEKRNLEKIAVENGILDPDGSSVFVIDHEKIRENYRAFTKKLPRVQAYYAVKANSEPEILKTLYDIGASFDVASYHEFMLVYKLIENLPEQERQNFIWDKMIYANTIKTIGTLEKINQYKPLVTFDNLYELEKIKKYAPNAGLILRLRVPNTGSMVELSSKFGADPGEAVTLIKNAIEKGLNVEGLSFHVGSQCVNFQNYLDALEISSAIFKEAELRGCEIGAERNGMRRKQLDIGGGFPVSYDGISERFDELALLLNSEIDRLFPADDYDILAEPGRFIVANACTLVAKIIGKAIRDNKNCYYLNDGIYHTFSGIVFDHCKYPLKAFKEGELETSTVFGPTCDAFDTLSLTERLPRLEINDLVYAENIGAYSIVSSTFFNGFLAAKVVHINK